MGLARVRPPSAPRGRLGGVRRWHETSRPTGGHRVRGPGPGAASQDLAQIVKRGRQASCPVTEQVDTQDSLPPTRCQALSQEAITGDQHTKLVPVRTADGPYQPGWVPASLVRLRPEARGQSCGLSQTSLTCDERAPLHTA